MFLKRIAFFILLLNSGVFLHVSAMNVAPDAKPFMAATSSSMSASSSASTGSSTYTKIDLDKPLTKDESVDVLKQFSNPDAAIGDEVIDYIKKGNVTEFKKIEVLPTKSPLRAYIIEVFSYANPAYQTTTENASANRAETAFRMISHMVNAWKVDPNTQVDSDGNTMLHLCSRNAKYGTGIAKPVYETLLAKLRTLKDINVKAVNKFEQTLENVTEAEPKIAKSKSTSSSKPSAETTDTTKLNAPKSSNIWKWLLGGGTVAIFIYLFNRFNSNADEDED